MIFKTKGKSKGARQDSVWYPQPLQVSSTYTFLHRSIDAAYVRLKRQDPDFEMRLGGLREKPQFAHNTWRRLAATAAQASLTAKRCDKEDVELHMGWQLRKHAKEMRLHYAERERSESMSGKNDRDDLSGEGAVRPGICHGRAYAPAG